MDAQTVVMMNEKPAHDSDQTWHEHVDGTWDWGINCLVCCKGRSFDVVPFEGMNIEHLKMQNADGMTVRELEREAIGDRWDDPNVNRPR